MKFLFRVSLGLVFAAIILLGIVVAAMRLTLQNIQHFRSEIEYVLSGDETGRVVFSRVEGEMKRFNPVLRIMDVSIALPDRSQTVFISHLELEFDFWQSLRYRAPVLLESSGRLESMELHRDADRRWWLNDLELGTDAPREYVESFSQLLALVPRYLDLDLDRLIIRDDVSGRTHELERVNLRIDSRQDQLRLQMAASLPQSLGEEILLKSSIGADRGQVYLATTGLELIPLSDLIGFERMDLQDGIVEGQVWINLEGAKIASVAGDVELRDGLLQVERDRSVIDLAYRSRFNAFNRDDSWVVANQVVKLSVDGVDVPPFTSQVQVSVNDRHGHLSIWFDRVQLSTLPLLAGQWLPPEIGEQLRLSRMRGWLEDVMIEADLGRKGDFRASGRLVGISSRRSGNLPGLRNLDAEVVALRDRLALKIESRDLQLDFGDHFVEPLRLDRLSADAVVQKFDSAIVLSANRVQAANADIKTQARLWMKFDEADRPFMFVRAQFAEGQGSSTRKYLPLEFLPPKAYRWLEAGIKDGYVPRGNLQYHGRLRNLRELAPQRAVEFIVDFDVEGGRVFFRPGWLEARDGQGHVVFHNTSLHIDLDRLSYDRLRDLRATLSIANLGKAVLEAKIRADVPAQQALAVWAGTPVGQPFGETIARVDAASGRVQAAIDLSLPIGVAGEAKTRVVLDIDDVAARASAWNLDLTRTKGRVEVVGNRLRASNIESRYFGDPVRIDIAQDEDTDATVIHARGTIASRNLLRGLPTIWQQSIGGNSDWNLRLAFDNRGGDDRRPFMTLHAHSDLKQTQVRLPQPFGKPAAGIRALAADLDFYPRRLHLDASLGADIRLRGRFAAGDDDGYRLEALDVGFSTQLASAPHSGLNLYGHIPSASLGDWIEFARTSQAVDPSYLQSASLSFDQVILYDRLLDRVRVEVRRAEDRYLGRLESSLARGNFEWPLRLSPQQPVVLEMDYLRVDKLENEPDYSTLTPGMFADFRFAIDRLDYHGMQFDDVRIDGRVVGEALHIDKLLMRRDQIRLNGSGIWEYDAESGAHRSSLNVGIHGNDLGNAISGLGFGESLSRGSIDLSGGLTWPAPIMGVDLENMVGDADLRIEEGVLNNVEPGSGRFVGLLSLSALPRRLSLDFSDMLVEGMVFKSISGTYRIGNGNLYTRNTRLDGPAAEIRISGRTGFIERNYDQTVKVTPQVTGVLNLGALYSGNWALLLLQNLFKKTIDDAFEIEYKISGSWDDPRIDLIKAVDENQRDLPSNER